MEKSKISINVEGGFLFCGGLNFLKSVSVGSMFIREMRVCKQKNEIISECFTIIMNILLSPFMVSSLYKRVDNTKVYKKRDNLIQT